MLPGEPKFPQKTEVWSKSCPAYCNEPMLASQWQPQCASASSRCPATPCPAVLRNAHVCQRGAEKLDSYQGTRPPRLRPKPTCTHTCVVKQTKTGNKRNTLPQIFLLGMQKMSFLNSLKPSQWPPRRRTQNQLHTCKHTKTLRYENTQIHRQIQIRLPRRQRKTYSRPPRLGPKTNRGFFFPGAASGSSAMCGPKSMNRDAWNGERRSST